MPIDGIFPCPHCGTGVTAWRDNRTDGPFFVPDHHDPYQPHICDGAATHLKRIADTMLDLALMVAEGNGHGPWGDTRRGESAAAHPPARPVGTGGRAQAAGQTAPPPQGAQPVALPRPTHPTNGRTVDV